MTVQLYFLSSRGRNYHGRTERRRGERKTDILLRYDMELDRYLTAIRLPSVSLGLASVQAMESSQTQNLVEKFTKEAKYALSPQH